MNSRRPFEPVEDPSSAAAAAQDGGGAPGGPARPSPRKPGRVLGRSVERLEDGPLVTGRGRFVGDVSFPHQLHMRVVRSAHAHGRLLSIERAQALALPGVVAVWTAADIAGLGPIDFRDPAAEALKPYRQPLLAIDRVRYVGEPVAVVFAQDAYVAEDAADLVLVEVEPLGVTLTADGPVGQFADSLGSEPIVLRAGYGDTAAAFSRAHCIIEIELAIGRHSGVPLETRGAIGRYVAATDMLELWGAAKVPHRNRDALAALLGRSPQAVQLREGHVGGGFGIRGELYPEDVLVSIAALRLGRAVKWIEDRREHLMAANQSRQQYHRLRAAVAADGTVLALEDEFFHDQGAYVRTHAARVADVTIGMLPGPYRIPAFKAVGHYRLTNKTPAATYRAPGRYEGTFVRERLMDAVAARLGLDRLEVRRRNLIAADEMPFSRDLSALGDHVVYDSGDYRLLLDKALAWSGWDALRARVERRRSDGELVGLGLGLFVEKSGLGPMDGARVSIDHSGSVELVTGGASLGQGFETVMAQICAEALGVSHRSVRVVHGQTDRIAFGIGAHATRATVMTGSAANVAALKVREKALDLASELLQTPVAALDIVDGTVCRSGDPGGPSLRLGEIARLLAPGSKHLGEREPGLSAEGWFTTDHMVYPYGVHIALVRVDRDTGRTDVEAYFVAYDVGRAVNPMLIEGQIAGGCAQGLGGALFEEFVYSEAGDPLAVTLADYLMPTAREVAPIAVLVTEDAPSPRNPLGLKGAGEGGVNGVGAAIASAIDDAIGIPGAVTSLPVTPQRLKAILDRASV